MFELNEKTSKKLEVVLMLAYPVSFENDNGAVQAISTGFPEFDTFSYDREKTVARPSQRLKNPQPSGSTTIRTFPRCSTAGSPLYCQV